MTPAIIDIIRAARAYRDQLPQDVGAHWHLTRLLDAIAALNTAHAEARYQLRREAALLRGAVEAMTAMPPIAGDHAEDPTLVDLTARRVR